jgi:signal transduction histidine kinase
MVFSAGVNLSPRGRVDIPPIAREAGDYRLESAIMTKTEFNAPSLQSVFGRSHLTMLALGFIALIAMAVLSVVLTQRNRDAFILATQTQTVLSDTVRTMELLGDAETGQRGFLLTLKDSYLAPFTNASTLIPDQLSKLVDETRLLPISPTVRDLEAATNGKMAELSATIRIYQSGGQAAALEEVNTDKGKVLMESARMAAKKIRVDQQKQLLDQLEIARATGRFLMIAQVGSAVWVLAVAFLTGVGLYRNVRALHVAQDVLETTNANLEDIVAVRTSALTQANEEVQKFAYIVSHDLRAPLVNIMGFNSELEAASKTIGKYIHERREIEGGAPREVLDAILEDVPEALGFIKTSTAKMDRLITAILKLSREGRRVLTAEPIAMKALLEGIAETLKHRADEMNAAIVVETVPNLTADRLAIEQIFGNLMENAVKYLLPGRPGAITIRGVTQAPFAVFEIADNGRGIAPGDRERVFELFRRAGRQDVPGEGIGLAYVRQLVYRLGGTIELESTFGIGTTFRVTLPLVASKMQKAEI